MQDFAGYDQLRRADRARGEDDAYGGRNSSSLRLGGGRKIRLQWYRLSDRPWISPAITAGLLSVVLRRWKTYRGRAFLGRPTYVTDDPAVTRLNAICRSGEARRHLWSESFRLSCIMFVVLWTAALLLRRHLNWTWPSARNDFLLDEQIGESGSWFWVSMFGPLVSMFVVLFGDCQLRCLKMWVKREVATHS